jgi:tetratricopeptide (TPR) repeat protein
MKHKQRRNAGAGVRKPRPVSEKRPGKPRALTLRDLPFTELVTRAPELANARLEFVGKSPKERRRAAEWAYDSGMAHDLFSRALRTAGGNTDDDPGFDFGVVALAIDPLFAPALLTVGSLEYQHKRHEAAMEVFLALTTLPQSEPDLTVIIDKAGSFLLDQDDAKNAARLYRAATQSYPAVGEHWSSLSYCFGKMGELRDAVDTARQALALREDDPHVLNDLGWTLVLAGHYEEARQVLTRAVSLAPKGYDLPHNNLKELEKRETLAVVRRSGPDGEKGVSSPKRR